MFIYGFKPQAGRIPSSITSFSCPGKWAGLSLRLGVERRKERKLGKWAGLSFSLGVERWKERKLGKWDAGVVSQLEDFHVALGKEKENKPLPCHFVASGEREML